LILARRVVVISEHRRRGWRWPSLLCRTCWSPACHGLAAGDRLVPPWGCSRTRWEDGRPALVRGWRVW